MKILEVVTKYIPYVVHSEEIVTFNGATKDTIYIKDFNVLQLKIIIRDMKSNEALGYNDITNHYFKLCSQ